MLSRSVHFVCQSNKQSCVKPCGTEGPAETLHSWSAEIATMWRFTKNNGITEGFHTKMKLSSRQAYGFRNFENCRMRVKVLCGWEFGVFEFGPRCWRRAENRGIEAKLLILKWR